MSPSVPPHHFLSPSMIHVMPKAKQPSVVPVEITSPIK